MSIRLPGRSNCSIAKPGSKRSFLGLSTVADTAHLEERIQVLQAAEDRAAKMTNFLSSKLQKGAALMSSYIRDGELKKKEMSRNLIHLQMEVAVMMMLRAAEDATRELNTLTDSVLKGKLNSEIISNLHQGDLLAIMFKNNKIPVLSFAVSSLKPMKLNCTLVDHDHLCKLPGDDYVSTSKFDFDQPAVTHSSTYYSTIFDALNSNAKDDFPNCLEKKIGLNLTWRYFCWGAKGRRGQRMEPSIMTLSLHSAEPEKVLVDLEDLQVAATVDSAESVALLDFESTAYLGTDELSSPYPSVGYWFDSKTLLLATLVVILLSCNCFALFVLFSLRKQVKRLDNKLTQTRQGLGVAETDISTT